ncbi:MAG: redox-active disulfide protein 2 [Flavobacterium sp. JAD_PAG50586_2]|nr:MAG: redox-active disulfide protein 2 [Flavobacterium sp. JAD_PAG50586_2]
MKRKEIDLSSLSIEELNKQAKKTKTIAGLLAGILLVEFVIGLFLTIRQGFSIFLVIPFAFLPILIVNHQNIKKINEEIARRNS